MFEIQVRKHERFSRKKVSILEQMQVLNGRGPGVQRIKRPLLASGTRCNVLWKFSERRKFDNPRNSSYKFRLFEKVEQIYKLFLINFIFNLMTMFSNNVLVQAWGKCQKNFCKILNMEKHSN